MIEVFFTKSFIKTVKYFDKDLKEEVFEKIDMFKNKDNHILLKVHKLHGEYKNYYSFSVNYKIRIVFLWSNKNKVTFYAIGDHDVYK